MTQPSPTKDSSEWPKMRWIHFKRLNLPISNQKITTISHKKTRSVGKRLQKQINKLGLNNFPMVITKIEVWKNKIKWSR